MQVPHSPEQMLAAGQALLPEEARQNMILLQFREPIPKWCAWEFNRIHLTPDMLLGGEENFHKPAIFQPQDGCCSMCGQKLERVEVWTGKCRNKLCARFNRLENLRPSRGVIRVEIPGDYLHQQIDGQELCSKLVLVLDRRYKPEVLAAVYRTAGLLCEQYGWGLL